MMLKYRMGLCLAPLSWLNFPTVKPDDQYARPKRVSFNQYEIHVDILYYNHILHHIFIWEELKLAIWKCCGHF